MSTTTIRHSETDEARVCRIVGRTLRWVYLQVGTRRADVRAFNVTTGLERGTQRHRTRGWFIPPRHLRELRRAA